MAPQRRHDGPPRVLGLCRVSTEEQAESGAGMGAQEYALRGEADRKGWDLELVPEPGTSAKDMRKRPVLLEQLRRLDAGEADMIAVAKLDRLSRSVIDFAAILERAQANGWAVVALDLGVDTSTPTGELIAGVMMHIAQWERKMIGLRTREGMAAKKRQNIVMGPPPRIPKHVIDRITAERAEGCPWRAIAANLTADGIPTASGGTTWAVSSVRSAATSQLARGIIRQPTKPKPAPQQPTEAPPMTAMPDDPSIDCDVCGDERFPDEIGVGHYRLTPDPDGRTEQDEVWCPGPTTRTLEATP